MEHKGSVVLRTERLVLRPYSVKDAEQAFMNIWGDRNVTDFLNLPPHKNAEITRNLLEMWEEGYASPTVYRWGIEKDGELVGDISVTRWKEEDAWCEIGYCMAKKCQSQGLMTEAVSRVLDFLLHDVGFHRVQGRYDTQNPASGQVMRKCGMREEGVSRGCKRRRDGNFYDVCCCAKLNTDE